MLLFPSRSWSKSIRMFSLMAGKPQANNDACRASAETSSGIILEMHIISPKRMGAHEPYQPSCYLHED